MLFSDCCVHPVGRDSKDPCLSLVPCTSGSGPESVPLQFPFRLLHLDQLHSSASLIPCPWTPETPVLVWPYSASALPCCVCRLFLRIEVLGCLCLLQLLLWVAVGGKQELRTSLAELERGQSPALNAVKH